MFKKPGGELRACICGPNLLQCLFHAPTSHSRLLCGHHHLRYKASALANIPPTQIRHPQLELHLSRDTQRPLPKMSKSDCTEPSQKL
jgi:hypothetical protein